MSALLIAYDLNKPGQNYTNLFNAIEALGRSRHYLDSTWIVVSSLTPTQAYATLASHVDNNDSMLIMNVTNDAFDGWLPQAAWDWLNRYF